MEKRMHLNIFDFDETLFRVPGYTCKEAKSMSPYEWFDSPESLSSEFNVRGILNTCEQTQAQPSTISSLITHRVEACRDRIFEILSENSIKFDDTFFLGRETPKSKIALSLIDKYSAGSVTIFEDSLWEIIKYVEDFGNASLDVDVDFVFIDKSRVITIAWETACLLARNSSVKKLQLI